MSGPQEIEADVQFVLGHAMADTAGNLPSMPAVFPNYAAPVVRNDRDGGRELTLMRWGFPPPPNFGSQPVTNVRNVKSSYWRGWLKPEWPATSFSEYENTEPKKTPVWFALAESRPLFCFAGIWRPWTGTRKKAEGEMDHRLFSFLTCPANGIVAPIHREAMPVILTTQDEIDTWMSARAEEALKLQRPLLDEALKIVARGERMDEAALVA